MYWLHCFEKVGSPLSLCLHYELVHAAVCCVYIEVDSQKFTQQCSGHVPLEDCTLYEHRQTYRCSNDLKVQLRESLNNFIQLLQVCIQIYFLTQRALRNLFLPYCNYLSFHLMHFIIGTTLNISLSKVCDQLGIQSSMPFDRATSICSLLFVQRAKVKCF